MTRCLSRLWSLAFAWSICALLASCGGSTSDGGDNPDDPCGGRCVEPSVKELDGYVTSAMFRDTINGLQVGDHDHIQVGRTVRSFISFDMPEDLPGVAEVQSATITLYQLSPVNDPLGPIKKVVVDHVDYGTSLDPTEHDITPVTANIGVLSDILIPGFRSLDISVLFNQARADGRTRLQFRLRLDPGPESDGDILEDTMRFEDGDDSQGTGNIPQMVVQYTLP